MREKKTWYLWQDGARSPFENMAIDELLLTRSAETGMVILRVYLWDRPSVSIGYVQNYRAAPAENYTIVRRPTGGGIVFHDIDLTYTVVVPQNHDICKLDRMESYNVFHQAVLEAAEEFGLKGTLAEAEMAPVDRSTMKCFVTPTRYDVLADNRKIAGSAQRRTRNGILHQGSIALEASSGNWQAMKDALIDGFQRSFMIEFKEFCPKKEFLVEAAILAEEKYATDEWNHRLFFS